MPFNNGFGSGAFRGGAFYGGAFGRTAQARVYGVIHQHSIDYMTRTDKSIGLVANPNGLQNDFDNIMPWAGMRRCNLSDDLTVNAYYGDAGYTEDGSNGQVMVEVPAFYYKRSIIDDDNRSTQISAKPKTGFKLHPWFYDSSGNPVSKKYFGAYEGSIYDVSAGDYLLADEQIADFTVSTGDKLCSIANAKPCSGLSQNLTLPNSRILANNRGADWNQQYFTAVSAIQMLMIVEYASSNSQSKIGLGVVNKESGTGNESELTGVTSALGNTSGQPTGTNGLTSISYRGIENFWGNIWKLTDGINISNTTPYVSTVNGNFVSNVFTGQYKAVGTLQNTNGYFSEEILNYNYDYGYLPAVTDGTSNSYYADYFYQNGVGSFVARLGGGWNHGSFAGAFYWRLNSSSSARFRDVGARLCV